MLPVSLLINAGIILYYIIYYIITTTTLHDHPRHKVGAWIVVKEMQLATQETKRQPKAKRWEADDRARDTLIVYYNIIYI